MVVLNTYPAPNCMKAGYAFFFLFDWECKMNFAYK